MKVFLNVLIVLYNLLRGKSRGYCIKQFCMNCGITYIKFGQMLAMQNYGDLFTERDRQDLLAVTDDCKHVPYTHIHEILSKEYGSRLKTAFKRIYRQPVGSASVSQVHKAVLYNGDIVAVKVKRQDIQKNIHRDIRRIKTFFVLFGKVFGLYNVIGGKTGLTYFEEWLAEELDFKHEVKNILRYTEFAESVNGCVEGTSNIVLPGVYAELCTPNVIVMQFIESPTLSKRQVSSDVPLAMNAYVRLSFYALFHHMPIVWHGDPHAGNIYIDDEGNVGFLDMGLLFELTEHEADLCLQLFLSAFLQKEEKLYELISPWLGDVSDRDMFKEELKVYCNNIPNIPITSYFMDLVWVSMRCHINPPRWLYNMAKAFVCLNGIDTVYFQQATGRELLLEQVMEYMLDENIGAAKDISKDVLRGVLGIVLRDKSLVVRSATRGVQAIEQLLKLY